VKTLFSEVLRLPEPLALIILIGFAILLLGISIFMLTRPKKALWALRKFGSTTLINIGELGTRAIIGWAFLSYADASNVPTAFRVIGAFLIITAAIIICIPKRFHNQYAVYWAERFPPNRVRLFSLFSFGAVVALIGALL